MPNPPSAVNSNKRGARRQRMLLAGKLVFGKGAYTSNCAIREISETGARIKTPSKDLLANDVYLIDIRNGFVHEARVVWRKPFEFGLQLSARYDLTNLPSELAYLRPIWVECSVR
jgi:hypothetical protein